MSDTASDEAPTTTDERLLITWENHVRLLVNPSVWSSMTLALGIPSVLLGIFFLSFAYKHVLWIYIGLTGAFHGATRRHDPAFEVRFGWRDAGLLIAANVALTVGMFAYTRLRAP